MSLLETPSLSPSRRARIVRNAVHGGDFRLFANHVRIAGNEPGPLRQFSRLYGRFALGPPQAAGPDIEIHYEQRATGSGTSLTFVADGQAYRIRHPELVGHAFTTLVYLVLINVRSHFIFHAGCVATHGQGLAVAATSGMGKTTLIAHLAAAGLDFLSDELAPLERGTCMVEPFPLRLGIRPGPAEALLADKQTEFFSFRDDHKKLISVEALTGRRPGGRAPLHAVVFLATEPDKEVATLRKFSHEMRITFFELTSAFDAALRGCPGVAVLEQGEDNRFPVRTLHIEEPAEFTERFRRLCDEHGIEPVSVAYEDLDAPDYNAAPCLVPISAAAGVMELVKKMPPAYKNAIVQNAFNGRASEMVREVSALVAAVRFYRLSPGRIEEMVRMVRDLMK